MRIRIRKSKVVRIHILIRIPILIYFSVEGQTNAEVGILEAAISSKDPCTLIRFSKPLAFNIEAATVER